MASIYEAFEKNHGQTLKELDRLYEALRKLRYEGKAQRGKNTREIVGMISRFNHEMAEHLEEEEKILFPFLERHLPRLQSLIYLLLSEHEDFRNSLDRMRSSLHLLKAGADASVTAHQLYQRGIYFICLLRSHMWVESQNLYKTADRELKPGEKRELIKCVNKRGSHVAGEKTEPLTVILK